MTLLADNKNCEKLSSLNLKIMRSIQSLMQRDEDCISLLLARLPKLPRQDYSNGSCSLGNLGSSKEKQPFSYRLFSNKALMYHIVESQSRVFVQSSILR